MRFRVFQDSLTTWDIVDATRPLHHGLDGAHASYRKAISGRQLGGCDLAAVTQSARCMGLICQGAAGVLSGGSQR